MARRKNSGFLRLADNPFDDGDQFADDDFVDDEDVDDEAVGGDGDIDYEDEDDFVDDEDEVDGDDEDEMEDPSMMHSAAYMSMARKGRRVSGPRTKLSKQLDALTKAQATLMRSQGETIAMQRSIAKALTTISRANAVLLTKMDDFDSDFQPYGDGADDSGAYNEDEEEATMNEPGLSLARKARVRKAAPRSRLSKDDAASSFGEKDDDIVGNRPSVPDDKNKDAEEYLIQGDAGDGPGPVSKSARDAASIVLSELRKAGVLPSATKKSRSPSVGNSMTTLRKSEDEDMGFATIVKAGKIVQIPVLKPMLARNPDGTMVMDHSDISRVRENIGDLPRNSIFN